MFIEISLFIILILSQLSLGIASWVNKGKLFKKYSFVLGSMTHPAKTLENYVKIYRKVNLRVNSAINQPAFALNNFLLVKRDLMYSPDLYSNFFTIFQLEMTKNSNRFVRNLYKYQSFLFAAELLLFSLGISLEVEWAVFLVYAAIAVQLTLYLITFWAKYLLAEILNEVLFVSKDLLDLDEVEAARAESLKQDMEYSLFDYPIDFLWRIVMFFKP